MPSTPEKTSVLVTICTRGRPKLLQSCLDSVCAQLPHCHADMEILVVENNERLTTEKLIENQRQKSGRKIHLALEPQLGIPFARNRCGVLAHDYGFDWALYIDDDEVATEESADEIKRVAFAGGCGGTKIFSIRDSTCN